MVRLGHDLWLWRREKLRRGRRAEGEIRGISKFRPFNAKI